MNDTTQILSQRINDGQATVGIIGLGYVGLPLAIALTGSLILTWRSWGWLLRKSDE